MRRTHSFISKEVLSRDRVLEDLWVENLATTHKLELGVALSSRDFPGVQLWDETDTHWIVPRGYISDSQAQWEGATADLPPFRLRLRSDQLKAAASLTENIGKDKILCLGCGKGKTILGLWYAAQLGRKTIVVVDRDFLVEQWIQRIKQSFWLPRSRVARIQGNHKVVDADITVASVQTLIRRDLPDEFFEQFGLVIADECHIMAAPSFADVIPRFPCERLGLTATPYRKDGLGAVFHMHLGGKEPVFTDLSRSRSAQWFFVRLPRLISADAETKCMRRLWKLQKANGAPVYALNRAKYDTAASNSLSWENIISQEVRKAYDSGRCVLLLGTRTGQLKRLRDRLLNQGVDVGYVDSKIKGEARNLEFKRQVILSTTGLASRALDIPRLDTLMLLYPSDDEGFVRQAVGRLDRDEGKSPIVVIYSHYYINSLAKKESQMSSVLRKIDPKATIKVVRRNHVG